MTAHPCGWLRRLLLAVLTACSSLQAADAWNFPVSPKGQPNLAIGLGLVSRDLLFEPIALRHELIFDGTRYWSRMVAPELESYLITHGADEYEWCRIGGSIVILSVDHEVQSGNRSWKLARESDGAYAVGSTDGVEVFRYRHSRLESAEVGASSYRFDFSERQLVATRRAPTFHPLFSIDYRPDGMIRELAIGGKTYSFGYNAAQQLTHCWIEPAHALFATFEYRDGLLVRAEARGRTEQFHWGLPRFEEYFQLPTPSMPVVTDDGAYAYRATIDRSGLTIFFQSRSNRQEGSWHVDSRTHQVEMRESPAR